MVRGLSSYSNLTNISLNVNRNPIIQEGFTSYSPLIHDGMYTASGTFGGLVRKAIWNKIVGSTSGLSAGIDVGKVIFDTNDVVISDDVTGYAIKKMAVTSLELQVQLKDFARFTASFIGQNIISGASTTNATPVDEDPVIFYSTVIDGGSVKCTNLSVKIDRPIESDYYVLGSRFLKTEDDGYFQAGPTLISGSFSIASLEYAQINDLVTTLSDPTDIEIIEDELNTVSMSIETSVGTIDLGMAKIVNGTMSTQGRAKFEKSLDFVCEVTSDYNWAIV